VIGALKGARRSAAKHARSSSNVSVSPLWARAYRGYSGAVPDHPGKRRLLRLLHEVGLRSGRPFACEMANGAWLAIRPQEGILVSETVGWTCFTRRAWDPHIEACIRTILRPGDCAIDVGANLGYCTAVMAQCVGPSGRVWSLEPVTETFELLELCRSLNGYTQVTPLNLALGATHGSIEITYDNRHSGIATMHADQVAGNTRRVELRPLDELVSSGEVGGRPDLMKVDVEGHEFDVLRGASKTIAEALPAIVFELNERTARVAGWTLAQAAELLVSLGEYSFSLIDESGTRPLDPFTFHLEPDARLDPHVDVLARPARGRR
jgi:FkbM family methyltransferase